MANLNSLQRWHDCAFKHNMRLTISEIGHPQFDVVAFIATPDWLHSSKFNATYEYMNDVDGSVVEMHFTEVNRKRSP